MQRLDLSGQRFGKLVAQRYVKTINGHSYWECLCDCGNIVDVQTMRLRSGHTKSCGCLKHERLPNEYDLSGRYAKMIFEDGTETIFNKKYYNFVKQYHWWLQGNHVYGHVDGKSKALAVAIFEEAEFIRIGRDFVVDHINRDPLDNRRSNLRICDYCENAANHSIQKNNTSGVTGVYYDKIHDRWMAKIGYRGKLIHLGFFDDKNDAIKARKRAEKEYHGRFAPH
jgi:hypothetical protein